MSQIEIHPPLSRETSVLQTYRWTCIGGFTCIKQLGFRLGLGFGANSETGRTALTPYSPFKMSNRTGRGPKRLVGCRLVPQKRNTVVLFPHKSLFDLNYSRFRSSDFVGPISYQEKQNVITNKSLISLCIPIVN